MARRPVTTIKTQSPLIGRLHRWRLSKGMGRTLAAQALTDFLPIPINRRNLDSWEQGIHEPGKGTAALLNDFLHGQGF